LKIISPQQGTILLNDTPIQAVQQESIWNTANVVLQENHFFHGTIRDNLLIEDHEITDHQIESVLEKVQLGDFSLTDPVFEKGEKQRLAIARAILKDGPLWVFDEPTSSIDALTEQSIYEYLFEHAKDDTFIFVSHRLTGLEKMDQIIVMDQGRVIETGTFSELMQKQGYLYEMKKLESSLI